MRPILRFLNDELIDKIVAEARALLCKLGVEVQNEGASRLLSDHGARIDASSHRVIFKEDLIDRALAAVPRAFKLYDVLGNEAVDLSGYNTNFTPGSAAITVLDGATNRISRPSTPDYVRYAKLMARMDHIASQATAMIPSDVHERVSDSYRLYLSLLHCEKPVVTGAFTSREAFRSMRDLQLAVRGTRENLATEPLPAHGHGPWPWKKKKKKKKKGI